jgi:hypothetical protein
MLIAKFSRIETLKQLLQAAQELVERSKYFLVIQKLRPISSLRFKPLRAKKAPANAARRAYEMSVN